MSSATAGRHTHMTAASEHWEHECRHNIQSAPHFTASTHTRTLNTVMTIDAETFTHDGVSLLRAV